MSLKNKVIVLLLCLFAVYAVIEYAIQHFVLLPAFAKLEVQAATSNTERAIHALEREAELLIPSATDWATWDDTYQFMEDQNEEFSASNLNLKALESLRANLLAFYDVEGKRVWGVSYDFEKEEDLALGELSDESLESTHPLLAASDANKTVAGLRVTPAGTLLVVSRPILNSNGEGPSRGRVVIGRLLDEAAIARLGNQARVDLKLVSLPNQSTVAPHRLKDSDKIAHSPIILSEYQSVTQGSSDLFDIAGVPILRLQVDTPQTIIAQGQATIRFASLSLAVSGAVVLLALLIFLRHTVFEPIALLTRHAVAIGSKGDLNACLVIRSKDEIGTLAHEFNVMVERLAETRQRLLEQSYQSGIAEMASGALHNIGNAITPIGVKLINLRREFKQAPVEEMAMASSELADPATPADRRADLARFSELAGHELAVLVTRAADELETIRYQVDHVQMILADQRRFSRAERTVEPLLLHRLIDETVAILPEEFRDKMHIEIDEKVVELGHVSATRIALQQVISNLLVNAAESIREFGHAQDSGRIRVFLADSLEDNQQHLAHVCFEDNGVGISQEQLPHIFERGYSSKSRGSGVGLHWVANTMSAMGGRIYATSSGPGKGACFHLLLLLNGDKTSTSNGEHVA